MCKVYEGVVKTLGLAYPQYLVMQVLWRQGLPFLSRHPIGVINESNLTEDLYSRCGKDLLPNPAGGKTILELIRLNKKSKLAVDRIAEATANDVSLRGSLRLVKGADL